MNKFTKITLLLVSLITYKISAIENQTIIKGDITQIKTLITASNITDEEKSLLLTQLIKDEKSFTENSSAFNTLKKLFILLGTTLTGAIAGVVVLGGLTYMFIKNDKPSDGGGDFVAISIAAGAIGGTILGASVGGSITGIPIGFAPLK